MKALKFALLASSALAFTPMNGGAATAPVSCSATGNDTVASSCGASGTISGNPGDTVTVTLSCQPPAKTFTPAVEHCQATGTIPNTTCVVLTPTSGGSVTDAAGHVWTLDSGGNVREDGVAVNNGAGTDKLTYIAGSSGDGIWAEDAGGTGWYFWTVALNNWTSATLPTCNGGPPPPPPGNFTLGGYTFPNVSPDFGEFFADLSHIAGDVPTADPKYTFYASGERGPNDGTGLFGWTSYCCGIYKAPDDKTYSPYRLLNGGGVGIVAHKVPGASGGNQPTNWPGFRSGVLQTLANDGSGPQWKYGYVEGVLKLPNYPGATTGGPMGPSFPAFWMLSPTHGQAQSFETDYEQYGACGPGPNNGALQLSVTQHNPDAGGQSKAVALGFDAGADYHKYGILWTPTTYNFVIDRNIVWSIPTPTYLTTNPGYLIIGLDWFLTGCQTGGANLEGVELDIKSVQYWKLTH